MLWVPRFFSRPALYCSCSILLSVLYWQCYWEFSSIRKGSQKRCEQWKFGTHSYLSEVYIKEAFSSDKIVVKIKCPRVHMYSYPFYKLVALAYTFIQFFRMNVGKFVSRWEEIEHANCTVQCFALYKIIMKGTTIFFRAFPSWFGSSLRLPAFQTSEIPLYCPQSFNKQNIHERLPFPCQFMPLRQHRDCLSLFQCQSSACQSNTPSYLPTVQFFIAKLNQTELLIMQQTIQIKCPLSTRIQSSSPLFKFRHSTTYVCIPLDGFRS